MNFKSLFGPITILSLSLVNFRVSRFHVSHLTHVTFKLCLQNTLNMSKTARVYFGVLQLSFGLAPNFCALSIDLLCSLGTSRVAAEVAETAAVDESL